MKTSKLHPDYLALVNRFRLRPIRSEREHDSAMKIVTELAVRDETSLSPGERDYLETLAVLLEDFDRRETAPPPDLDGVDLLRHLLVSRIRSSWAIRAPLHPASRRCVSSK